MQLVAVSWVAKHFFLAEPQDFEDVVAIELELESLQDVPLLCFSNITHSQSPSPCPPCTSHSV